MAKYAAAFLDVINHPLAIVDDKLRIAWVNPLFCKAFHLSKAETVGVRFDNLAGAAWNVSGLMSRLEGLAATGGVFRDVGVSYRFGDGVTKPMRVSGSRIEPMAGDSKLILLSFEGDFSAAPLHREE